MLFTLQRYEFFSKSQPTSQKVTSRPYVVYPTKVRIFQQITTSRGFILTDGMMLFTLQRYEFFSKSQHWNVNAYQAAWCCLPYKGTNFSANHNNTFYEEYSNVDVVYPTKVRIFQQITTWVTAFYTVTCNKQI